MSKKYSYELKLKVVREYLDGDLGPSSLARKYHISSDSLIHKWINQYKEHGEEGLQRIHTKTHYPLNFKINVLRFKQDTGASYQETANAFDISEPSIIANWHKKWLKEGTEGLSKLQGRPPKMPKETKQPNQASDSQQQDIMEELELLKKENEYLRIELEYLKKLKARGLKDPRANNKPS